MMEVYGIGLIKDEEIVDDCRQSVFKYLLHYLLGLLIISGGVYLQFNNLSGIKYLPFSIIIIGLFTIFITFIINKSKVLICTNKRVIYKKGVLNIETKDLDINKIQNIKINHNIIEDLLDIGEMSIDTSGSAKFEVNMKGVPNISKRMAVIKRLMETEEDE